MTSLLFLLGVMVGQPGPDVKVSIRIVPAKPAADGKTIFAVEATVTGANGKPIANAPVRFGAEGYAQASDGTIVGSYGDMKRDVDYQVLMPAGGLWDGRSVTNTLDATTDKNGIAASSTSLHLGGTTWRAPQRASPLLIRRSIRRTSNLQSRRISRLATRRWRRVLIEGEELAP